MQGYRLIASFVHGNALGVVLEPSYARDQVDEAALPNTWQVRIGPLTVEAAVGAEFPKEDFQAVVDDLAAFCDKHLIDRGLKRTEK